MIRITAQLPILFALALPAAAQVVQPTQGETAAQAPSDQAATTARPEEAGTADDPITVLLGDVWEWPPCPADLIREAYQAATEAFQVQDMAFIENEVLQACQWRGRLVDGALRADREVRLTWEEWAGVDAAIITVPESEVSSEAVETEPLPVAPALRPAAHYRTLVVGGSGDSFVAVIRSVEEIDGEPAGSEYRAEEGTTLPGDVTVVAIDRRSVTVRDGEGDSRLVRWSAAEIEGRSE